MSEIGLFEAINTLRAMRRLKPDPVPLELIRKVLAAGTKAPSGQNTQPWAFVVVQDPEGKKFIQERYHAPTLKIRYCKRRSQGSAEGLRHLTFSSGPQRRLARGNFLKKDGGRL